MDGRRWLGPVACFALVALLMVACTSGSSGGSAQTVPEATTTASTAPGQTTVATAPGGSCATPAAALPPSRGSGQSVYLANVNFPTALAWAPDGRLFIAERAGTVKVDRAGTVDVFATVDTVTTQSGGGYSERGLLGLALSPEFPTDHYVFALYSTTDHQSTVVVRWTDCASKATDMKTLVTLPAGADCCHKGGRLAFGPDGMLYVTIGDEHSVPTPPGGPNPPVPQNTSDPRGKVLRYTPDGTIPADNPFGASSPVWAAGFRNPFGLAFGPNGTALVTVNGPTGDAGSPGTGYDLATQVKAGIVYQWPYCYGYNHLISPYQSCQGKPSPDWSSEQKTVVPTGVTWVDNDGPASMAGHFVFCNDSDGMRIFTPGTEHATVASGPSACHLDVKQGPDHSVYYSDETTIYRFG